MWMPGRGCVDKGECNGNGLRSRTPLLEVGLTHFCSIGSISTNGGASRRPRRGTWPIRVNATGAGTRSQSESLDIYASAIALSRIASGPAGACWQRRSGTCSKTMTWRSRRAVESSPLSRLSCVMAGPPCWSSAKCDGGRSVDTARHVLIYAVTSWRKPPSRRCGRERRVPPLNAGCAWTLQEILLAGGSLEIVPQIVP
jgi:hypothetical protein